MREKRVARGKPTPWITSEVLQLIQKRDALLKKARLSSLPDDWDTYRSVRNKASNPIKSTKYKFYNNCFDENKSNPKGVWKIIKSLMGTDKKTETRSTSKLSANDFNVHFTSVADSLRNLLPSVPFNISKLEHFVLSRKDPETVFSIPRIQILDIQLIVFKL